MPRKKHVNRISLIAEGIVEGRDINWPELSRDDLLGIIGCLSGQVSTLKSEIQSHYLAPNDLRRRKYGK